MSIVEEIQNFVTPTAGVILDPQANIPKSTPDNSRLNQISSTSTHHLCSSHYKQCVDERKLDSKWILANCYSLTALEATDRLGYTAKSGGIWLQGFNVQAQLRPDKPWISAQDKSARGKKAPKYRSPNGDYDVMLPIHPDEPNYWSDLEALKKRCYQIDGHPCLLLTEGFFKAIAGCSNDLPTISVIGVEMGLTSAKSDPQGKRYLVPGLERLVKAGFGFIIGFDSDAATNSMVVNAQSKLAHQLKLFGCPVYSITGLWNIEEGKGIDDYISMNGADKFKREILGKVISIEAWEAQFKTVGDDEKLSPTHKAWIQLEKIYGERIRWNEMSLRCEIDGKPARNLEGLYLDLELDYNIAISKEKVYDLMIRLARRHTYHPVKEYLERVASKIEPIDIDNLATRFLKTTLPIYDAMIKAHLIGSVKRIFEPGCKKDEALILQGKQGIGKSTFFTKLYGREFFSDSLKGTDRDSLLILHQFWCLEMAEIESITSKREVGELKAFITSQEDTFRSPYGRSSEPHERQSVLVGTVNPDTFLQDETGNRRFWVIPVKSRIDTVELEKFRDAIWAAAVVAYRNGEPSLLNQEEELLVNELNTNYIHQDSWHQIIENYLIQRQQVTTAEILEKALGVEVSRFDKRSEMRVAAILRQMGWQKSRGTYLGKNMKFWQSSTLPTLSTLSTPLEEVGNHTEQGIRPPCPPISQNFPATSVDVQDQQVNNNKEKLGTEVDKVGKTHTQQGMPTSQPPFLEVDEVDEVDKTHTQQGMPTSQPPLPSKDSDPSPAPVTKVKQLKGVPYPGLTGHNQTREPKEIAEALKNITSIADHQELLNKYGRERLAWVWTNLLSKTERQQLTLIVKGEIVQLNILENSAAIEPTPDETIAPALTSQFAPLDENAQFALDILLTVANAEDAGVAFKAFGALDEATKETVWKLVPDERRLELHQWKDESA